MTQAISFRVDGTPAPKGSKKFLLRRGNGQPIIIDGNSKAVKSWSADVAGAARTAMAQMPMFSGRALQVVIVFRLVRPAGHFGKAGLKRSAPAFPQVKPDLDKLLRATMDPLEGVVYDGDSRIVAFDARKVYAGPGEVAGADITVEVVGQPVERLVEQSLLGLGGAA